MRALFPKDVREAAKWASGFIGAAAAVVGILAALGVLSGSAPEQALAQAAREAKEAGSSRVILDMRVPPVDGRPAATVRASGMLDYENDRGLMRYVLTDNDATRWAVEVRFVDDGVFLRPPAEWGISTETPWIGATLDELRRATREGSDPRVALLASLRFEDLSTSLEYLEDAGDVDARGTDVVGGTETTRYDGTVYAGDSEISVSAWIDDDHILRRMLLTLPDKSQADVAFHDFGSDVHVPEPPEERVIGIDELLSLQ